MFQTGNFLVRRVFPTMVTLVGIIIVDYPTLLISVFGFPFLFHYKTKKKTSEKSARYNHDIFHGTKLAELRWREKFGETSRLSLSCGRWLWEGTAQLEFNIWITFYFCSDICCLCLFENYSFCLFLWSYGVFASMCFCFCVWYKLHRSLFVSKLCLIVVCIWKK